MNRCTATVSGLILSALLPSAASAAPIFSFVAEQEDYLAAPGSRVDVRIYLQELTGESEASLLLAEAGLFSAGVRLEPIAPLPSQPATILAAGDMVADPQFTGGFLADPASATLLAIDGILAEPGPVGQLLAPRLRRVPIGTFTFTAGSILNETTSFKVIDYDDLGKSEDTLTWAGTVLDPQINLSTFSIHVVIPEPSAILLLPAIGGCLLRRRRSDSQTGLYS